MWLAWACHAVTIGVLERTRRQTADTRGIGLSSRSSEEGHLADDHLVERDPESPKVAGKRYPGKTALAEELRGMEGWCPSHPLSAFLPAVLAAISIPPDVVERLEAVPTAADVPVAALVLGI